MLRSLRQISLANYDYRQVKELCSDPSFSNVFDCDWGVWRDKAVADFGISPEFFDLVRSKASNGIRTLSGSQRYLQISTYERLTEDSLAKSVDEGVYEAVAGFIEAVLRDDYNMVLFFYRNLTKVQKEYISEDWEYIFENLDREYPTFEQAKKLIRLGRARPPKEMDDYSLLERGSEEAFLELLHDERRKDPDYPQRMDFLYSVLISGRLDFIDAIIHDYFILPEGFSISRDIACIPFWEYQGDILYDLPPQEHIHDIEVLQIAESVLTGCNSRVVDFFRSMFRDYIEENEVEVPLFLQRGLRIQTLYPRPEPVLPRPAKAEEAYSIVKRFTSLAFSYDFMPELVLDEVRESPYSGPYDSVTDAVLDQTGNIAFIVSVLPYFDKEHIRRSISKISNVYPLEEKLLRG
jgi:hypothetical protein